MIQEKTNNIIITDHYTIEDAIQTLASEGFNSVKKSHFTEAYDITNFWVKINDNTKIVYRPELNHFVCKKNNHEHFCVIDSEAFKEKQSKIITKADALKLISEQYSLVVDDNCFYDKNRNKICNIGNIHKTNPKFAIINEKDIEMYPKINRVHNIQYLPQHKMLYLINNNEKILNSYQKPYILPKADKNQEGRKLLIKILNFIFGSKEKEKRIFLEILAWELQNQGMRRDWVALLVGEQGIGKTMISQILGAITKDIYNNNFSSINAIDLLSEYNDYFANIHICLAEDLDKVRTKFLTDFYTTIKILMNSTLWINEKFGKKYKINNCINFIVTANDLNSLNLPAGTERKVCVLSCVPNKAHPENEKFYNPYIIMLRDNNLLTEIEKINKYKWLSDISYFLKYEIKIENLVIGQAPETSEKIIMQDNNKTSIENIIENLKNTDPLLWNLSFARAEDLARFINVNFPDIKANKNNVIKAVETMHKRNNVEEYVKRCRIQHLKITVSKQNTQDVFITDKKTITLIVWDNLTMFDEYNNKRLENIKEQLQNNCRLLYTNKGTMYKDYFIKYYEAFTSDK